ncbi:hypothetical protein KDD17_05795 [Sulfitobacter albidus]|uniref:Uncharacterized protein n=1 Tax=Sulfitobacter albidus TaxID=2829501 RepID=A0A975JFR7_9RHOB|nr:hypothetical protein [Sulfitobacter albidus]QUJ77502.1 hypothetical protein KDD17_05795 [Sulfitobacter albidus]
MKTSATIAGIAAVALIAAAGFYMVEFEQTEEGALPDVNISAEGGNLPEYDAEVGDVDLTSEEVTVETPDVDVTMEESTVTVPGIDVTPPSDDS